MSTRAIGSRTAVHDAYVPRMTLPTWQRPVTIAVAVIAAATIAGGVLVARSQLQQPVIGFDRFHRAIGASVRVLLTRQLELQGAEAGALAGVVGLTVARGHEISAPRAHEAVETLGGSRCSRGAAIVDASGAVVAATSTVNGMPVAPHALGATMIGPPRLVVSENPADSDVTLIASAPLPGRAGTLVCAALANEAVGTSLPGYSETHTTNRAFLIRRVRDSVVVIGAAGTTSAARVIARLPVAAASPAVRRALAAGDWLGNTVDGGTRVRAYVSQDAAPGWAMLQTQSTAELLTGPRRWAALVVALAVLLAGGLTASWIVIVRLQRDSLVRSQLERRRLEAQLQALRMELNPHFLFNALNSIVALLRTGDPRGADRMLVSLGELLRATLATGSRAEIPLGSELSLVGLYLEIEQVRFSDRLTIDYDISPGTHGAYVPSLILQPLVENAVRHGLADASPPVELRVTAQRDGGLLRLTVENSGRPMSATSERAAGVGLKNARARLTELYGASRASLSLRERPGGGAVAEIRMPFRTDPVLCAAGDEDQSLPLTAWS